MRSTLAWSIVSVSLAVTLAAACGGGPGTAAVTPSDAEDYCRRSCQHDVTCDPNSTQTVEQCTTDCVGELAGWARADALDAFTSCIAALECTASDDTCTRTSCSPTATHDQYETRCRELFGACGVTDLDALCETDPATVDGGGDAGLVCYIAPAIVEELIACMGPQANCDSALSCMLAVFDSHGIDL
jgi:hypothetical protein